MEYDVRKGWIVVMLNIYVKVIGRDTCEERQCSEEEKRPYLTPQIPPAALKRVTSSKKCIADSGLEVTDTAQHL